MNFDRTKMIEALRGVIQRMHYPLEVMLGTVSKLLLQVSSDPIALAEG